MEKEDCVMSFDLLKHLSKEPVNFEEIAKGLKNANAKDGDAGKFGDVLQATLEALVKSPEDSNLNKIGQGLVEAVNDATVYDSALLEELNKGTLIDQMNTLTQSPNRYGRIFANRDNEERLPFFKKLQNISELVDENLEKTSREFTLNFYK